MDMMVPFLFVVMLIQCLGNLWHVSAADRLRKQLNRSQSQFDELHKAFQSMANTNKILQRELDLAYSTPDRSTSRD